MSKKATSDLSNRALAAYFQAASVANEVVQQPAPPCEVEVKGLRYVVLLNISGILAVYRVRVIHALPVLKRMRRWPKSLDAATRSEAVLI